MVDVSCRRVIQLNDGVVAAGRFLERKIRLHTGYSYDAIHVQNSCLAKCIIRS